MKSYTCIVEGKVTGGKFQSWVMDTANRLELKGWVRNVGDKKAEVLIQGDADAYASFRELLKTESPVPDLTSVDCKSIEYDKTYDVFEIRG